MIPLLQNKSMNEYLKSIKGISNYFHIQSGAKRAVMDGFTHLSAKIRFKKVVRIIRTTMIVFDPYLSVNDFIYYCSVTNSKRTSPKTILLKPLPVPVHAGRLMSVVGLKL